MTPELAQNYAEILQHPLEPGFQSLGFIFREAGHTIEQPVYQVLVDL